MNISNVCDAVFSTEEVDWKSQLTPESSTELMVFNKKPLFSDLLNKFPSWENFGYKVKNGYTGQISYAYGDEIYQSKALNFHKIYINPEDRQISMFVAIIKKENWMSQQDNFIYSWEEWTSSKAKNPKAKISNQYNLYIEFNGYIALYWIYDKFVVRRSRYGYPEADIDKHNSRLDNLKLMLKVFDPIIIDQGFVPNPWCFPDNAIITDNKTQKKRGLNFKNIKKTEITTKQNLLNGNATKAIATQKKLFKLKLDKPLSVRKLAKIAKVSTATIQKYRKKLEELNLLLKPKSVSNSCIK